MVFHTNRPADPVPAGGRSARLPARHSNAPVVLRDGMDVLHLQQLAGNESVASALNVQRRKPRAAPKAKTSTELTAEFVVAAAARGRFADQQQTLPPEMYGPPAPGGAYWRLNGLSPADLVAVLGLCGKPVREQLLAHIAEADGRFDRPRLESAIRSVAWGEKTAGVAGLTLLDSIRTASTGSFAPVWAGLVGVNRVEMAARLSTLDRLTLVTLQTHLHQAPPADIPMLTQVITDLLGTGSNMQASDVIDVADLSALQKKMAGIYNLRGQLIFERATALGISTHAAAGIMKAESGGATFHEDTNKAIIRFENHIFWHQWGSANAATYQQYFRFASPPDKAWHGHEFRAAATDPWQTFHGDQVAEWRVIDFAAGLAGQEPAFNSASWGAGQIMGFNAASVGFTNSVDMAASYNSSERAQITGIFEFIQANNLMAAINRNDYLALATRYNGTGQAATYAATISNYATAYQTVTAGKTHVIP